MTTGEIALLAAGGIVAAGMMIMSGAFIAAALAAHRNAQHVRLDVPPQAPNVYPLSEHEVRLVLALRGVALPEPVVSPRIVAAINEMQVR